MSGVFSYTILGLIEGLTEFIPVSSSGHLILVRELLGITKNGLTVDAVLQLATILAVVVYFWKDLLNLLYTFLYWVTGRPTKNEDRRLLVALMVGTIPGVVLGLLLEQTMETVFRKAHLVAYALLAGSVLFVVAEMVSKRLNKNIGIEKINWKNGLLIGFFQAIALIPGMSRSGMTISGGLLLGFSRETAARFGFLLALPIIFGSGAKKMLDLYSGGESAILSLPFLWGSVVAFASGLLAIHILMNLVRTQPLYMFAIYRVFLAVTILIWL